MRSTRRGTSGRVCRERLGGVWKLSRHRREGVLFAVTTAATADSFLRSHLSSSVDAGHPTYLVSSPGPSLDAVSLETKASPVPLPLVRDLSPLKDGLSLVKALILMFRIRPRVTHVGTPKAGLIVGLASALMRTPTRIYTVHGLRFETAEGWRRCLLIAMERLACAASTRVIAVSPSVRKVMLTKRITSPRKIAVLGSGSISGVSLDEWANSESARASARQSLGFSSEMKVVTFVGRLARDKGIVDLANAWRQVAEQVPNGRLLVVGALEGAHQEDLTTAMEELRRHPSATMLGHLRDVRPIVFASDLLVLPSYREGFGNVILEAAAASVPTVATEVTGCVDAVVDGVTGRLVPPGTPAALADAVIELLHDNESRTFMGRAARARVEREFSTSEVVDRYMRAMGVLWVR